MDLELERYFFENSATDLYRSISHLEIEDEDGTRIPIGNILETEVRVRLRKLLRDHIAACNVQLDVDERIEASRKKLEGMSRDPDIVI